MPLYKYVCQTCGRDQELFRSVAERHATVVCPTCRSLCQKALVAPLVRTFEPYFDEGLGSDVYSESDRRQLMRERGVIEAGDKVGGARNFDPKAPELVKKVPPKGVRPKIRAPKDFPVETVDAGGKVVSRALFSELPTL